MKASSITAGAQMWALPCLQLLPPGTVLGAAWGERRWSSSSGAAAGATTSPDRLQFHLPVQSSWHGPLPELAEGR